MKKRYSAEHIINVIKRQEAGKQVDDICRELGISSATFHYLHSKYAGLEVTEPKRLKDLEAEINKLKKLLADKLPKDQAMKNLLSKE